MRDLKFAPGAVESALTVIRRYAPEATALIAALLEKRGGSQTPVTALSCSDLNDFAAASGKSDATAIKDALTIVDNDFVEAFGFALFADVYAYLPGSDALPTFSPAFVDLVETPLVARAIVGPPSVDAATLAWVEAVPTVAGDASGHNFVVRVASGGPDCADLGALLVAQDRAETRLAAGVGRMAALLFRAELHAGVRRPVIIVDDQLLLEQSGHRDDDRCRQADLAIRGGVDLDLLRRLRCVYVWRIPPYGSLPAALDGIVAGCIGPMRFDRRDYAKSLARTGLGPYGIAALQAMVDDPRAVAPALAAVSALASGNTLSRDAAAIFLARSHGARFDNLPRRRADFDASLLVCDQDVEELLARAAHLAHHGARILLVGPPAGGKTTLGLELSQRLLESGKARGALGEPIALLATDILASKWGATERLLRASFENAATAGDAPLFVDEFDAFAGIRLQGGATSNNDGLVRALTDELLRDLDLFASVPVVACCNDALSIDPAVRRRFHFVVSIEADLDPARERRAWKALVGVEPPRGWRPAGAALGDIASAVAKCRMLGKETPADFVEAIVRARGARRGTAFAARKSGAFH